MIVGFKGESSKLKNLYKELELKEMKAETLEELEQTIKSIDGESVIVNYNDLMVYDNATADIVEKKAKIMKVISALKKNLFLGLVKDDPSIDKVKLDVAIETKVNTKDMKEIEALYNFVNTDLAFNGKLSDDEYVVKESGEERGTARNVAAIKKLFK